MEFVAPGVPDLDRDASWAESPSPAVPPPIRRLPLEDAPAAAQATAPVGASAGAGVAAPGGFTAARRSIGAPQFSIRRMEIDNVSVSYSNREAVKSVSLPVRQGEVLAMIGPSGCGKTTLLRSLNRLTELTRTANLSGRILLDDVDITPDRADLAAAPGDDGLPAAQPVPDERLRQHRLRPARAGLAAPAQEVARAQGPQRPRPRRPLRGGQGRPRPSRPEALRRPAAAALHRPGTGGRTRRCCCSTSPARRSTRSRPR